jgi:hypothetical protein
MIAFWVFCCILVSVSSSAEIPVSTTVTSSNNHNLDRVKYSIRFPKNFVTQPSQFPEDIILIPTIGKHTSAGVHAEQVDSRGYIIVKVFDGLRSECNYKPSMVMGTHTDVCFTVVDDKTYHPIGSVVYHFRKIKILTTEYASYDCSGTPIVTMATLYPLNLCFQTPLQNATMVSTFVQNAKPWLEQPPGVNFL